MRPAGAAEGEGRRPLNNMRIALGAALVGILLSGCNGVKLPGGEVPPPMLPAQIRIHGHTGMRTFSDGGGIKGIEAQIEVLDTMGDRTKAFGSFRFELYTYNSARPDPRGKRIAVWARDVKTLEANREHWDRLFQAYRFQLAWDEPIAVGRKFVLQVIFSSPYGSRLFDQRTFVSGE